MIKGYKHNDNISLLNVFYDMGNYKNDIDDSLTIVYKDLDTNEKKCQTIRNPDFKYYLLKSEAVDSLELISYPCSFYRHSYDYDVVTTKYRDLNKSIAENVGEVKRYYNNIKNGNSFENKKYRKHYKVEGTDHYIADFYMHEFNKMYKNSPYQITKSFLDIEVDILNSKGDFVEPGECPINVVTFFLESNNTSYTLILRDDSNSQIFEFENELKNDSNKIINDLFDNIKTCMKNENDIVEYNFNNTDFKFIFFDKEIELIKSIFVINNEMKPDFVLAWNMAFDIPYIIERVKRLGYDPNLILCHDDFEVKVCSYYIDERHKNDANLRGDFANISSYSVFIDQMIHFASINSSQRSKYGNWKLDTIGSIVAGVNKLKYPYNIKEFPYKNFKIFVFYNIIDVLVQVAIERKSKIIDFIFNKSLSNCTRYSKIHRQSIYLTNALRMSLESSGKIISTNRKEYTKEAINDTDDEEKEGYPGAFVADPLKLNDYSKTRVNGHPVNLYRNDVDLDYKGLYPHSDIQFNIGHESMIGKLSIDINLDTQKVYEYKYFEPGSHFIMNLQSKNFIGIGNEFLNLPTIDNIYDEIKRRYRNDI